ncbi:MAG: DUF177 domain-containing protein [Odoribacter sp.]|nr:DUF177 domain-containing protein [Odoribacter sp.]
MDKLREYKIAFRGLGTGRHVFEYVLDDAFFDAFEATQGTKGRVDAVVEIVKSSLLMEVKLRINGVVKAVCDRCLGEMDLPVEGEMSLYVKQSEREEGNGDDYIIVQPDDDFLDMSTYLYEAYMLNYPMRVVHPEGECEEGMRAVLKEYMREEDEKPTDPRWDELKKLINNK